MGILVQMYLKLKRPTKETYSQFWHTKETYERDRVWWMHPGWHMWTRHGTHEWVIAHINKWLDTYGCVVARINASWHMWMGHGIYECIMAHENESCHIYMCHWAMPNIDCSWHIRMSHSTCKLGMTHLDASWHIWMRHGTWEWVRAHMNTSWRIWMRHGTYGCVMAHENESGHIWIRHGTYEYVMAHMNTSWHIWIRHGTYGCVMAHMDASWHMRMSQGTYERWMEYTHASEYMEVQPILRGMTFSQALSKLNARSSNGCFHYNMAQERFELWDLSLKQHLKMSPQVGIYGCIMARIWKRHIQASYESVMAHMNASYHIHMMYACVTHAPVKRLPLSLYLCLFLFVALPQPLIFLSPPPFLSAPPA